MRRVPEGKVMALLVGCRPSKPSQNELCPSREMPPEFPRGEEGMRVGGGWCRMSEPEKGEDIVFVCAWLGWEEPVHGVGAQTEKSIHKGQQHWQ